METPAPYTAGTVTPTRPGHYVDVRSQHSGKLLFRYDSARQLVEVQHRGHVEIVDLTQYMK